MGLTLAVARHAATDAEGLCVGSHDVPTFLGADLAAAKIHAQLRTLPDVLWSSPLSRCALPAAHLAAVLGRPHRVEERLLELHYGTWQGRPWREIERDEPEAFARFMERWREEGPPGGESLRDLEARIAGWYASLASGSHFIVAHAGVVRALRVITQGVDWESAMQRPVPHLVVESIVTAAAAD